VNDEQHRVPATRWPVDDEPSGLSVNAERNVLITCAAARKIKEYSSYGELVREITLPVDVVNPLHAIQLAGGEPGLRRGLESGPRYRYP